MTEGAWIEGNTVHIVIDFGDLAIHREGVRNLDALLRLGLLITSVESQEGAHVVLVHTCDSCGAPATHSVALYDEGEERVWFCEKCAAT